VLSDAICRGRPKGTPSRKAPNFITPPKKSLFRKRKATPEIWKKNVRKKLRLTGKEYISAKGNIVQERCLKPNDSFTPNVANKYFLQT
jgi:hypothetical protein